jgi:hypothetical protein
VSRVRIDYVSFSYIAFMKTFLRYQFENPENAALFEMEPQRYLPQYGGFCAWGIRFVCFWIGVVVFSLIKFSAFPSKFHNAFLFLSLDFFYSFSSQW